MFSSAEEGAAGPAPQLLHVLYAVRDAAALAQDYARHFGARPIARDDGAPAGRARLLLGFEGAGPDPLIARDERLPRAALLELRELAPAANGGPDRPTLSV